MNPNLINCTLCGVETNESRHFNLFVVGSEGIECCMDCCIALTDAARGIKLAANRARKYGYKATKQVAEACVDALSARKS